MEKLDFLKKIRSRLSSVEKDTLYQKLQEGVHDSLLFRQVCQSLDEGVLILDLRGRPTYVNPRAEIWLGIAPDKNPVPLWTILEDRQLSAFLEKNIPAIRQKTVSHLKILTPREMEFRVSLEPYAVGDREGFLVMLRDMTRRSEREFEEAMLQRMDSLLRLAGGIAHEIGNPLNAITIHLELLKKRLKGIPEAKRTELETYLADIQQETKRLDKIIRNFLKATRKPPLRFQTSPLDEILADTLNFLKPELTASKIRLKFTHDDTIPPFLLDRERLYYAFMNLVKNAMEAMPQGGDLKVSLMRKGNCAIVSIQDTGCGIAQENLQHVFDIYYTTKEEGSGLGLMMVYDAITEHGGRVEVASKLKKGTTFRVFLPIREPRKQLPDYATPHGGDVSHA